VPCAFLQHALEIHFANQTATHGRVSEEIKAKLAQESLTQTLGVPHINNHKDYMKRCFWMMTLAAAFVARGEDWAQWRGPHFNGSSADKHLPAKWTKESARWAVSLPGPSAATPVIRGDRVFVATPDESTKTLHALCLDRKSGKVLWDKETGQGISRDNMSNFAAPSPVADKDQVFFFFSTGALFAFDDKGKELWTRNITKDYGEFAFQWTFSASPLLHDGKLYIQVLQRNEPVHGHGRTDGPIESYIVALDPKTGKNLWKTTRPNEAAAESKESYATPLPFEYHGRKEIVIVGGDCLTGHDPENGKELWRWGTWNPTKIGHWRLVPSAVAGDGVILACAPKGSAIYAIKAGGKGTLDNSAIAWTTEKNRDISSDVPTPALYDGDFFILSDGRRNLARVEPATGKVKWTVEIPGRKKWEASPTAADGKIYMMNFGGEVVVADAAKGSILSTIAMGDEGDDKTRSTIAVAHGELFIRTNHKLYCVGEK
jgi:outer membrane protein assembly factor BamB